jgi:hypothetical protein
MGHRLGPDGRVPAAGSAADRKDRGGDEHAQEAHGISFLRVLAELVQVGRSGLPSSTMHRYSKKRKGILGTAWG